MLSAEDGLIMMAFAMRAQSIDFRQQYLWWISINPPPREWMIFTLMGALDKDIEIVGRSIDRYVSWLEEHHA